MTGSIATPRTAVSREIYTGDDLRRTSPRQGAYDAYAIPSRMGDRLVTREQQREELLAPLPPAPPVPISRGTSRVAEPEPAPLGDPPASPPPAPEPLQPPPTVTYVNRVPPPAIKGYRPRGGSFPDLVITHLREHGGHLFYSEICERYSILPTSITSIFKPPLFHGALIRLRIGKRTALALPGYQPDASLRVAPVPLPTYPHSAPPIAVDQVPGIRPVLPQINTNTGNSPALSAADIGRALESAARLLMQAAAALQSLPSTSTN